MREPQVVSQAKELRNKEGKLEEALGLLEKYEKTSPKEDLPFVQHAIAILLHDTGKNIEAIEKHKLTIQSAMDTNNIHIQADSLRRLGWELWMMNNNVTEAMEYEEKSWKLTKDNLNDPFFQRIAANIWAAKGNIQYGEKKYSESLESYDKALDFAKKCSFEQRVCTVNGDIANVYIDQRKYDEARVKLEEGYKYAKENYRHSVPSSLIRLARLFSLDDYEGKDLKKAEKLLEEALKVTQSEKWRRDEAEVYDGFYRLYLIRDDMKKADINEKKAIEIYRELGMMDRIENLKRSN